MKKENKVVYIYRVALVLLALYIFEQFDNLDSSQVKVLLDFYKDVVEVFFGGYHYFVEDTGYYVGSNYIIGVNCLGLNIIALIFGVCSQVNISKLKGIKRIAWILFCGIMAVVVGVFSNLLRLLSSIYFTAFARFELIHALLGIVVYLSAIILCYSFSTRILKTNDGGESVEKHI